MASFLVYGELYPVIQINGQRIIGPCENWQKFGTTPDDSKEIFINRIPHCLSEVELLPIFASVGPVWKFRLMMNFSGQNRGFAYLQYVHETNYIRAMQLLNGKVFISRYVINMTMSRNNCTLVMGGIDKKFNQNLVISTIETLINAKRLNCTLTEKGFAVFVMDFYNHRDAALSRRTLLQYITAFGQNAWVRWGRN